MGSSARTRPAAGSGVHPSQGVAESQQTTVSGDLISIAVNVLANPAHQHAKCVVGAAAAGALLAHHRRRRL